MLLFLLFPLANIKAQESLISVLTQTLVDADKAFIAKNYQKALLIYEDIAQTDEAPNNIDLRLARSYYFTYRYEKAIKHYKKYEKTKLEFPMEDYFYFAEALTSSDSTELALHYFKICMEKKPNNELYAGRIWRLSNLSYLYEDSIKNMAHYASLNSSHSELQMVQASDKEVYLISNMPQVEMIKKIDSKENSSFYNLRKIKTYEDPFSIVALNYENSEPAGQKLKVQFHLPAISIFDDGNQMVYASSAKRKNDKDNYPLQLYFAKKRKGKWVKNSDYEHNQPNFNISEPAISNDGKILIFSANFANGFGGKDLYRSIKTEEGWSPPENLGNSINTERDERFPFIYKSNLYFSTNGHPGLGGFDLYKAKLINGVYQEVENLGYPVNSTYDELSFTIDSLGQQGFLSSNRVNRGFDFDIYEFALDLQVYPLQVEGVVKFIEHNWMDSTELQVLSYVEMELIDRTVNSVVAETKTDANGKFNLKVPYYSEYKIRIRGEGLDGFVIFEVPKFAKQDVSYELVVVNDDFKNSLSEEND
ncbi:tetratricopeptide repeat protein [Marivirga salinae]|uniref:Tetratricopeptide repeat protein n=1 Tax=Marivirga salinarum TaxID=3059078 RepID=A0AA51NCK6_9BACT|nr:tetratricopeptide repeat protein [Marivirga sp. BDSF4-3]WMN11096.1 tetratricopeptide repeat protein [Marivirga sp. BDSF4-3]